MCAMLELKNVNKTFNAGTINEKHVLKDLNLTMEEGDFVTAVSYTHLTLPTR